MTVTREHIEARERETLAPYAMRSADSRGRDHGQTPDLYRTEFQRDRDRIVHSRAFRRLAYKTQVFINDEGDLVRSRLTHTMEVSQLARSAAKRLRLNEDLVECIAYAHDIGHPPFGHRGEDLLNELLEDEGGFDHHMQSLRILEEFEVRYPQYPGLDLTYEVRESVVKHGSGDLMTAPKRFRPEERRLLEAILVDEVDSIAYDCHDIDDAFRAGIIDLGQLSEVPLWQGAWSDAEAISPVGTSEKLLFDRALRVLMDALLTDLIEHSQRQLDAAALASEAMVRAHKDAVIEQSPSMQDAKRELEQWLFKHVYRDWRINRTFRKARLILEQLFEHYVSYPDCLPGEHQLRIESVGLKRTIGDYLAGMTDRYAQEEHRRLFLPFTRAW